MRKNYNKTLNKSKAKKIKSFKKKGGKKSKKSRKCSVSSSKMFGGSLMSKIHLSNKDFLATPETRDSWKNSVCTVCKAPIREGEVYKAGFFLGAPLQVLKGSGSLYHKICPPRAPPLTINMSTVEERHVSRTVEADRDEPVHGVIRRVFGEQIEIESVVFGEDEIIEPDTFANWDIEDGGTLILDLKLPEDLVLPDDEELELPDDEDLVADELGLRCIGENYHHLIGAQSFINNKLRSFASVNWRVGEPHGPLFLQSTIKQHFLREGELMDGWYVRPDRGAGNMDAMKTYIETNFAPHLQADGAALPAGLTRDWVEIFVLMVAKFIKGPYAHGKYGSNPAGEIAKAAISAMNNRMGTDDWDQGIEVSWDWVLNSRDKLDSNYMSEGIDSGRTRRDLILDILGFLLRDYEWFKNNRQSLGLSVGVRRNVTYPPYLQRCKDKDKTGLFQQAGQAEEP